MSALVKRVLPADVYDALELSAMAFGGIGPYAVMRGASPCCAYGHAAFVCGEIPESSGDAKQTEAGEALVRAGVAVIVNDTAVVNINSRRRFPRKARVPFDLWCTELGVERGT